MGTKNWNFMQIRLLHRASFVQIMLMKYFGASQIHLENVLFLSDVWQGPTQEFIDLGTLNVLVRQSSVSTDQTGKYNQRDDQF